MSENEETVIINFDEEQEIVYEDHKHTDLTQAYIKLGKAFYENNYNEPTPELIYYFDQVSKLLRTQHNDHIIEMDDEKKPPQPKTLADLPSIPSKVEDKSSTSDINFCPQCGSVYESDSVFCGNCGARIK